MLNMGNQEIERVGPGGSMPYVACVRLRHACSGHMQDAFDLFIGASVFDGDAFGGIRLREVPRGVKRLHMSLGEDWQIAGRNMKCFCMPCRHVHGVAQIAQESEAGPS